ncbi:hypothetical protein IAR55_006833 [Kwoniella newhampshirensis]|uniref:RING-type domain-containing protein n=1 Tax=Kwoniella newhampshirensis TaxID=1651941 RepID=A0AAW0YTM3_9TREE
MTWLSPHPPSEGLEERSRLDVPRSPSPSPLCDFQGEKMEATHVEFGSVPGEGLEVNLDLESEVEDEEEGHESWMDIVSAPDTEAVLGFQEKKEIRARISISSSSSFINIFPPDTPPSQSEQYDLVWKIPTTVTERHEPSLHSVEQGTSGRTAGHPPLPLLLSQSHLNVSFIHLSPTSLEPPPSRRSHRLYSSSPSPFVETDSSQRRSTSAPCTCRRSSPSTRSTTMSVIVPGQSSMDFGEEMESTWHGLRRALSLTSSGSSVSGGHKQGRRGGRSWRVLADSPEITSPRRRTDSDSKHPVTIESSPKPAQEGGDFASEAREREGLIPSGPSSPVDTDRFSLLDLVLPFPRPPGMTFRDIGRLGTTEESDEHTIMIRPPSTFAGNEQDEGDECKFNGQQQRRALVPSTSNTAPDNYPTESRFPSVSTQRRCSSQTSCPPSPALTPSPHLSSADSPILATPCGLDTQVTHLRSETDNSREASCVNTHTSFNTPHKRAIIPPPSALTPASDEPPSKAEEAQQHPLVTFPSSRSTPPLSLRSRRTSLPATSTTTALDSGGRSVSTVSPDTTDSSIDLASEKTPQHARNETSMPFSDFDPTGRERTRYDNQDSPDPRNSPLSSHLSDDNSRPPVAIRAKSVNPGVSPINSASSPPSYVPLTNTSSGTKSKRISKSTALSGSSGSSVLSYSTTTDSSSLRDSTHRSHGQLWHLGDRSDISTVFEEENSIELKTTDEKGRAHHPSKGSDFGHQPLQPRYPTITGYSSSQSTLVNRAPSISTSNYFSKERASTIISHSGTIASNRSSQSGASVKSVHPFASAVIRPTSPQSAISFDKNKDNTLLFPRVPARPGSPQLSNSRSSPNLAETYKMTESSQQVALVSMADDLEDEDTCPVCVESLSFTYRLPGEKPHIVPECGHALHEECFVTVYGDVPPEGSKKILGVCGVCRQPMKMAEGVSKRDKLAILMGQSGQSSGPKNAAQSTPSIRSSSGQGPTSALPFDPHADDPLEGPSGNSSGLRTSNGDTTQAKVVIPSISIRSEFPSISRGHKQGKQVFTTMVTVEVPPAGNKGKYPSRPRSIEMSSSRSMESQLSPRYPASLHSTRESPTIPTSARQSTPAETPDPFAHVVNDLKHRVLNYKTSGLDTLGSVRLFDLLSVRKGQLVREFHVYLFQEALICVSEEKKSGLRGIFSSSASTRSDRSTGSHHRGVLKLKGRIYIKHVRSVSDSSTPGELSLTISMKDETLDSFILTFRDRGSHETWRTTILRLQEEGQSSHQSKAERIMGPGAPRSSGGPTSAPEASFGDLTSPASTTFSSSTPFTSTCGPGSPVLGQETSPGDLAYVQPLGPVHTPIDLVVVLSLPAPSSSGQLPLKVKLMKSSLEFALALLGPRDRISLVTCEMGLNGMVRKTPFLSTARYESRKRLEMFVEALGSGRTSRDEFQVPVGQDERLDVVTAVNVALDVVLQRKAKNPLSGMVLISDTSDIIKRAQMDLVTARLDAANVPVHALGYGRSHDPSPLWMISNHTHGTYTFVKEWYDLRDTLAGVVGGLMSIAINNMKLHVSCQENDFRVTKVSGTTQAIVSQNGKTVDIELRELCHGEIREILVELDLEDSEGSGEQWYSGERLSRSGHTSVTGSQHGVLRTKTSYNSGATGLGIDTLAISDHDLVYEAALIDEVPVMEVDCSFHDPGAGRSVARLAHPVLLTLAITPPNGDSPGRTPRPADPMIVRRRMELLASDMITRALLIASRKNFSHASRILRETKRIIETIVEGLRGHTGGNGTAKSKREAQSMFAMEGLGGTIDDLETLLEGLEEHKEMFERDHRNYSAQQAGVLRAQKSWTMRTPTERSYCTKEVQQIIQLSGEWQGGNGGVRV